MDEVWVLSYRYRDGNGSGVLRAYASQSRGEQDMDLLRKEGDKEYELNQIPVYQGD